MSGKITFMTRLGKPKDEDRYESYPEWYWSVVGEDGVRTRVSPRYEELYDLILRAFVHELINDRLRARKPDEIIKRRMFDLKVLLDKAQTFVYQYGDDMDLLEWLKETDMNYITGNRMRESFGRNLCNYLYDKIANGKATAKISDLSG